ncbi:DUF726 domain-containing protein [Halobaculum sp. MBLA0143]|uniref:DUF726 domain-containing protein n=1 Tax=Halobaculum sp. MBLA0143 TaxID=3079933 RepID=UPI003524F478
MTEDGSRETDGETESALVTRRRVLGAGAGLLGLGGVGAGYVYTALQSSDGDYTAPASFPTLSTRGAFDEAGDAQFDGPHPTPRPNGVPDGDEFVLFVHGFQTDHESARDQAHTAAVGLSETTRPLPVVAYSWDSNREWGVAKSSAEANGRALAAWLAEYAGPPVHVVAHSLGARVTGETLRALAPDDTTTVASVSLLGGAIPHDSVEHDGRYGDAIAAASPPVRNYHSRRDRVLGWVYRLSDGTRAVGHGGAADPTATPDGYTDVDVTATVPDHRSYYEPGEGCLPAVAERLP